MRSTATAAVAAATAAPPLIATLQSAAADRWRWHNGAWWVKDVAEVGDVPGGRYGGRGWWRVPADLAEVAGRIPQIDAMRTLMLVPNRLPTKRPLRDYQASLVPWALDRHNVLIADSMRLGKTFSSLAIAYAASEFLSDPIYDTHPRWVAVVQASKLWDWAEEAAVSIPDPWGASVEIVRGRRDKKTPTSRDAWLYIVNYEVLPARLDFLGTLPNLQGVILDECVYVKSAKSSRHVAARDLCDAVRGVNGYVLGLSGEPIENRPWDLWGQFRCIRGEREWGKGISRFHRRYCGGQFVTDLDVFEDRAATGADPQWVAYDRGGMSNEDELAARLKSFMVRRRKDDPEVRASVPRVTWQLHSIEGANRAIPRAAAGIVADYVANGEKPLVFCYYKATVAAVVAEIEAELKSRGRETPVYVLTGDMSPQARDLTLRSTRTADAPVVIVATIDALGMGVDISHFDGLAFVELHYVPAKMIQAAERLYAVDRTRGYGIHFVAVRGSDDERLARVVMDKVRQADAIVGGSSESRGLGGVLQQTSRGGDVGLADLVRELRGIENG